MEPNDKEMLTCQICVFGNFATLYERETWTLRKEDITKFPLNKAQVNKQDINAEPAVKLVTSLKLSTDKSAAVC